MTPTTQALLPNITNMIRLDHTHVMATFHQYRTTDSPRVKRGLVQTVCLALEIHAQLEEEIFYPAMREAGPDEVLAKSEPEHDQMRELIARLRGMEPQDEDYDEVFMELMRDVLHHVADEETVLLPKAERLLHDRLGALGLEMTKRRIQLVAPRSMDIATNMAASMSWTTVAVGAALVGLVAAQCLKRRD